MVDFSDLSSLFGGGTDLTSGGFDPAQIGVGDVAPTPAPSGGLQFGDLAGAVGGFGKSLAGGIKDVLTPVGQVAGAIAPLAQLGAAGMGIASGVQGAKTAAANAATMRRAQRLQENVVGQQVAAAAPLTEFGKKTLEASTGGPLPPAVEAEIQQLLQGWIQSARDFAARSGQGDSLMLTQWENWLQGQAETLRQKWREGQQGIGVQALGQGAGALGGAGATAGQIQTGAQNESAAIASLIEQTNRALASLTAGAS